MKYKFPTHLVKYLGHSNKQINDNRKSITNSISQDVIKSMHLLIKKNIYNCFLKKYLIITKYLKIT